MSLILAVSLVAIVLGYLTGGRLSGLADLPLRRIWLVWAAFLLQLVVAFLSDSAREVLRLPLVGVSFVLVLSWIVLQRRVLRPVLRTALLIVAIGWGMNLTVIALNNGMPVSAEALERVGLPSDDIESGDLNKHVEADEDAKLPWLGDVIPLPLFGTLRKAVSLGDLVMLVGMALFLPAAMRTEDRR